MKNIIHVVVPVFLISASVWAAAPVKQPASAAQSQQTQSQIAPDLHRLQVYKNCKLLSERPLNANEISQWQQLQQAELKMAQLEIPMTQMQQELKKHETQMRELSSQIEQQAASRRIPDEELLEQTRQVSDRIQDITYSYQGDIDAISSHGEQIGQVADAFSKLVTDGLTEGSYDQLRVLQPGEQSDKSCNKGMFFSKTLRFSKN